MSTATPTTNSDILTQIHYGHQPPGDSDEKPGEVRKKDRRVRFPDGTIISGYLEPFRPAPDSCTSEVLITAYLESCFQHKAAPVDFLLEQLRGIDLSVCNERYNQLSLKGIRLTRQQVETLEEIFRRVHFRELDFENTYLDDQSAVALFEMLLHYETCNELKITLNLDRITASQAWNRCVAFIRRSGELRRFALLHTPLGIHNFLGISFFGLCLESLTLRDCNLSGQALFGLSRWLRLLLTSVSLEPPGRDRGASGATSRGSTRWHRRQARFGDVSSSSPKEPAIWRLKLDLGWNKLNAADAETLLLLIQHQLLVPEQPTVIDSETPESEAGVVTTNVSSEAHAVRSNEVPRHLLPIGGIGYLAELDLSNNCMRDEGLHVLCTGLLQSYRNRLRQLHAEEPITRGVAATATPPRPVNPTSSLSSDNDETPSVHSDTTQPSTNKPDGTQSTGTPQSRPDFRVRGLERLSLANNGLTTSGMQIIALLMMQTPISLVPHVGGLVSLDLSYNPAIRDEGIERLCEGLMRNHCLKELYLRAVRMSFSGVFALSSFLSESKCLKLLDIRGNPLDLAALMALSKTLAVNYSLTSLLSDARNMTSGNNGPLVATDVELILFLIDDLDACLHRNRSLEAKNNLPTRDTNPHAASVLPFVPVSNTSTDISDGIEATSSDVSESQNLVDEEYVPREVEDINSDPSAASPSENSLSNDPCSLLNELADADHETLSGAAHELEDVDNQPNVEVSKETASMESHSPPVITTLPFEALIPTTIPPSYSMDHQYEVQIEADTSSSDTRDGNCETLMHDSGLTSESTGEESVDGGFEQIILQPPSSSPQPSLDEMKSLEPALHIDDSSTEQGEVSVVETASSSSTVIDESTSKTNNPTDRRDAPGPRRGKKKRTKAAQKHTTLNGPVVRTSERTISKA